MKILKNVYQIVLNSLFIFLPKYWIMLNPYNSAVDQAIKRIIKNDSIVKIGDYHASTAKDAVSVWIGNYPYSYATIDGFSNARPSRATIWAFRKYINKKLSDQLAKKLGE